MLKLLAMFIFGVGNFHSRRTWYDIFTEAFW